MSYEQVARSLVVRGRSDVLQRKTRARSNRDLMAELYRYVAWTNNREESRRQEHKKVLVFPTSALSSCRLIPIESWSSSRTTPATSSCSW